MVSRKSMETVPQGKLRPPRVLTIAITNACNLVCSHCWVEAGALPAPAHVPVWLLRRIIEEFAALGGEGLRFTGGEPLCHPQWLELMRFSRSAGFHTISLQTNGMLFTDEHITAVRELDFPGLSIQISLDGATAAVHDPVRGTGAFDGAMAGILKLVRGGLAQRISLFFTEMRHNLQDLPAVLELADSMGIASVSSGAIVLCGRATEGAAVLPAGSEQYLHLLERYDTDPRFRELYRKIGTIAALEWRAGDAVRQECCTFVENPYLTPAGRLYPCLLCHADEYSVTDVFEKGLIAALAEGAPIWSSLLRISHRRAGAHPECHDCPGKLCCAGGCMGRAWGSCGNLLAVDDRCDARRAIYKRYANPVTEPRQK